MLDERENVCGEKFVNQWNKCVFLFWASRRGCRGICFPQMLRCCAQRLCGFLRSFSPPRRRAFRSNVFGLTRTTIPRDAKRQAEPPSRQGTHSRQKHFHCNPSRTPVRTHSPFRGEPSNPFARILFYDICLSPSVTENNEGG